MTTENQTSATIEGKAHRAMHVPPCAKTGPLFGPNRMKLGVFGLNLSSAGGITAAKDRHEINWDQNRRLVQLAERAGFEAAVPVARWRGFEGATNPWGESFETYSWAAGLAAATSRIAVFSTSHILTVSPVMAAKQISTIDHISNGRVALNVVSGWFKKELDMFGVGELDHDERYRYAEEWMEVVMRLWTEDKTFDFDGKHIQVKDGYQQPKSVQNPHPPVMCAALSPVGHDFAARWADIAFVSPGTDDLAGVKVKVDQLREKAASYGREIQIWAASSVACGATEAAARDEVERYLIREGDPEASANRSAWGLAGAKISEERQKNLAKNLNVAGGFPLVGTAQKIADNIAGLSEAGINGLCLTWMNFERGVPQFIEEVLPLVEKKGVRQPFSAGSLAA
jgi:FMNH2-dependent dimethyl sulfone monooxygenase